MGAGGEEIPGLSCTQVNWYQLGQTAVQIMLRAVADPKRHAPEHVLAPPAQLQVGQTTAPPAA